MGDNRKAQGEKPVSNRVGNLNYNEMSNTLKITQCDNELIILAVNATSSYKICDVQSGNGNSVALGIDIQAGAYKEPAVINGVNGHIKSPSEIVTIPSGSYSLVYMGLNWGGPYNFDMTFNEQPFFLKNDPSKPLTGAIWNRGNLDITFTV